MGLRKKLVISVASIACAGLIVFFLNDRYQVAAPETPPVVPFSNASENPVPGFSPREAPPSSDADQRDENNEAGYHASSSRWRQAIVLQESLQKSNGTDSGQTLRSRVVSDEGFPFPIRLIELVELDESGEPLAYTELSAYAANQVLLHSDTPIAKPEIDRIASALGWDYVEYESSRFVAVLQAKESRLDTVPKALAVLASSDLPLEAEANHIFYASGNPNDPKFLSSEQWSLNQESDIDIDAPQGWDIRNSAANVVVAIVDTGVRLDHEDLKSNLWVNQDEIPFNGRDDDQNGYIDDVNGLNCISPSMTPSDDNGHGTHVAGIAGASGNNGKGIAGVAWQVRLMAIKALNKDGKGTASNLAKAIDYAVENGAAIINASWRSDSYSSTIEAAIGRTGDNGVLFVAAAGNEANAYSAYPGRSQLPNVISVGAADRDGNLAGFSNYNETDVDVMAPGDDILSTWHETTNAYSRQTGTSMAAPLVSGALALAIAHFPGDDMSTQKQRLIVSSEKSDWLASASVSGGMVNLQKALEMEHVPSPPILSSASPRNVTVYEGSPIELSAVAESDLPLSYSWYLDDVPLDESSSTLSIPETASTQAGSYRLDIANADATISIVFTVHIHPRLREIEALLGSDFIVFGSSLEHWEIVELDGEKLITHKALPKETTAFLEFRSPNPGLLRLEARREHDPESQYSTDLYGPDSYASIYEQEWQAYDVSSRDEKGFSARLEHHNEYYSRTSDARILYLRPPGFSSFDKLPPVFRERLQSWTYSIGQIASFQVLSEQNDLSFQWYKDGQPIAGATSNELAITVSSIDAAGEYLVVATNPYGSLKSRKATLTVDTSPQPAGVIFYGDQYSHTIVAGEPFRIPMSVFGAEPITYQWYRNHRPIPGATSRELDIGRASPAHNGVYHLEVKNELQSSPQSSPWIWVTVSEQIFPPEFIQEHKESKNVVVAEGQQLATGFGSLPGSIRGSLPMDLIWHKDDVPLDNQSSSSLLVIDEVTPDDTGVYYLEAQNSIGTDQSGRITVQVTPPVNDALDGAGFHLLSQLPKTEDPDYLLNQSEETWDGVDALEFRVRAYGDQTLKFEAFPDETVLSFRWKPSLTDGYEFSYRNARYEWSELTSDGTWKKEVIRIAANQSLELRFEPAEVSATIWLDDFEIIKAPHILQQISYDLPRPGEQVILRAKFLGANLTYQWIKDGDPIEGESNSSLTIASFSASDSGEYRLKASNDHGDASTSLARVRTDILDTVVKNGLNFTFTGSARTQILAPSSETEKESILIESESQELWGFEGQIAGPLILEMTYDLGSSICFLSVDETQVQVPGSGPQSYSHFIQSGTHSVRFSFDPSTVPFSGKILEIKTRSGPIATLTPSDDIHYNEPGVPIAEFTGSAPLTLKWYMDGNLLATKTNLSSGESYPYNRRTNALDHGEYHFEITDKDGLTAVSEKVFFSQLHKLDEVVDLENGRVSLLYHSTTNAYFDQQIAAAGSSSLGIRGPFATDINRTIGLDVSASHATFKIRSQGFPEGSAIKYLYDGEYQELATNADWLEITTQTEDRRVFLKLPEGDSDSVLWIDQLTPYDKAVFSEQPRSISTYLGAKVEFEANAFLNRALSMLQLTWFKDGEELETDTFRSFPIESVQKEDLGEYIARATTLDGEFIYSKPASLTLTPKAFSEAIGYPGARITTISYEPWRIDFQDSIDGPSSLLSPTLEPGQSSEIIIEIDGMAAWGVYANEESDHSSEMTDDNKWIFHNANTDSDRQIHSVNLGIYESLDASSSSNRRLRVDAVRSTKFGDADYDSWIRERTADQTSTLPQRQRNSDIDEDGIPNWLEFTLNLDPNKRQPMPTTDIIKLDENDSDFVFQFFAARSGDYSITYETSYDLVNWTDAIPSLEVLSATQDYEELKVTLTRDPEHQHSPFFVRWTIHNLTDDSQGTFSTYSD